MRRYDIVVVNFFAPWCPWCQRLGPTWEAVTEQVHERYNDDDARLRFAKVDCTVEVDLCRKNQISAFPSIRIFNHGSDDVVVSTIIKAICLVKFWCIYTFVLTFYLACVLYEAS